MVHYEIRRFPPLDGCPGGGEPVADDDADAPARFCDEEGARRWLDAFLRRHGLTDGPEELYAVARVDVRILGPRLARRRPRV